MRTLLTRITKLEGIVLPGVPSQHHRVIGRTDAECEKRRRAMIDNGKAEEADSFIFRIIVSHEPLAA
jgi:hypothetical protein